MSADAPTERFSNRVADYVRYRPGYPAQLLPWLYATQGMKAGDVVADIGAGTGISSQLFLQAGHPVVAVEPNAAMRAAAVEALAGHPGFSAVDGSAEATTLADASVDVVSAAQAFHWFDKAAVKREWQRILKPDGLMVVFWNSRPVTGSAFLEGYEALLRDYGSDYASVAERYPDDVSMCEWLGDGLRGMASFDNHQLLDFDGLRGRLLSSSYAPPPARPPAPRRHACRPARVIRADRRRWPGRPEIRHPHLCRNPRLTCIR